MQKLNKIESKLAEKNLVIVGVIVSLLAFFNIQ